MRELGRGLGEVGGERRGSPALAMSRRWRSSSGRSRARTRRSGAWPLRASPVPSHDGSSSRHEAANIDRAVRPEVKAILVHQHHVTIGVERAPDLRRILIGDLVPYHRMRRGLAERGGFARRNVETLPVEESILQSGDGKLRPILRRAGGAARHGHALRSCQDRTGSNQNKKQRHRGTKRTNR